MSLFVVPAELDGNRIPQAYQFLERMGSDEPIVSGNLTQVLVKFLEKSQLSGFAHLLVKCNNVKVELNTVQAVQPLNNIQLFFFSLAKYVIRSKLQYSIQIIIQKHCFPYRRSFSNIWPSNRHPATKHCQQRQILILNLVYI